MPVNTVPRSKAPSKYEVMNSKMSQLNQDMTELERKYTFLCFDTSDNQSCYYRSSQSPERAKDIRKIEAEPHRQAKRELGA